MTESIREGDIEAVRQAIAPPGADLNNLGVKDSLMITPFLFACGCCQVDIIELLMNTPGVDVTERGTSEETPLIGACAYICATAAGFRKTDTVKLLLSNAPIADMVRTCMRASACI